MSAITGICDFLAIAGSASASSCDGTATRTIWQPEAVSSAICCRGAFTSAVSVVHIYCPLNGAPPPDEREARGGQLGNLLQGRVHVRGQRRAHRLHAHRRAAADGHVPHHQLTR